MVDRYSQQGMLMKNLSIKLLLVLSVCLNVGVLRADEDKALKSSGDVQAHTFQADLSQPESVEKLAPDTKHQADLAAFKIKAIANACHNEMDTYCNKQSDALPCLKKIFAIPDDTMLGSCCIAKIHQTSTTDSALIVKNFSGVNFSEGAKLQYDYFCENATLISTQVAEYRSMMLESGPLVFGRFGNLRLARLRGKQTIQGLQLDDTQPLTQFFENGVPKNVRLKGITDHYGIFFKPMGKPEEGENNRWSGVPTDLLYQLALSPKFVPDSTTTLHANGRIAKGNIAKPAVVKGLPLAPGITVFDENGSILSATLSKTHLLNGFLLGPGKISFRNNGELNEAVLAAGAKLNGLQVDVPSRITMGYQGNGARVLLGMLTMGANSLEPVKIGPFWQVTGRSLQLYPNGQVKALRTNGHSWYRGRLYPTNTEIKFAESGDITWDSFYDGLLAEAAANPNRRNHIPEVLPTAQVRGGRLLPKGSLIYSGRHSGEARVVVPFPFDFDGLEIAAGEFSVDLNLNIREAHLHKSTKHYDVELKAYPDKVYFSETGAITGATLFADTVIDGINYAKDTRMQFTPDGKVLHGRLATETTIEGREYKANSVIHLDANGVMKEGVLANDARIGGVLIPANSKISFQSAQNIEISSAEPIHVNNIKYSGSSLVLREDGSIVRAKLVQAAIINDEYIEADTELFFQQNGDIAHRIPPSEWDKLRATSAQVVMVGRERLEPVPPMTTQECQLYMEGLKQQRGYWLELSTGWSLGGGAYFQDCIDATIDGSQR